MNEPSLACRASVYASNGHRVIPIPYRQKRPVVMNWGDSPPITDFDAAFPTNKMNIGVVLGEPSGGLADVDLDSREAIELAPDLLPETDAMFGRKSKPQSHYLYKSDAYEKYPQAALQFRDPVSKEMLVELRLGGGGKAAQTVFPYSTHESGEPIEWDFLGEEAAAEVEGHALKQSVAKLAAASVLKRNWPRTGSRHQAQLALGNWLIRRGEWSEHDTIDFLCAIAGEPRKRAATVSDAMARLSSDDTAYGYPTLVELIGEKVMQAVSGWLEIEAASPARAADKVAVPAVLWTSPDMSLLSPPQTTPPSFPIEAFGEWADWIREAAEGKGAPPDYIAATLMTVVSSFIGNTRVISPWDDWTEPPMLWVAIVGSPSAGKSPAMDAVLSAVDQLEKQDEPDFEAAMEAYRKKEMIASVAKAAWKKLAQNAIATEEAMPPFPPEAEEPDKPTPPRYRIADVTTEKLVEILSLQDRGVLMVRDELSGWLASHERYNNSGGRSFYLEGFGGRRFRSERVRHETPQVVRRLSISILGSIQPDKLFSRFLASDDDGLVARFMYAWPDSSPIIRPEGAIDHTRLVRALRKVLDLDFGADLEGNPLPKKIGLTDSALEAFQEIREHCRRLEDDSQGMLTSVIGKFPGAVLRVAAALVHLDWSTTDEEPPSMIDLELIERARTLTFGYFLPMAKRCFGDAATAPEVRSAFNLARWVHEGDQTEFTVREVQRKKLFGLDTAEKIRGALDVLTDAGWVRYNPEESGGRPRQLYRVNPAIHAK